MHDASHEIEYSRMQSRLLTSDEVYRNGRTAARTIQLCFIMGNRCTHRVHVSFAADGMVKFRNCSSFFFRIIFFIIKIYERSALAALSAALCFAKRRDQWFHTAIIIHEINVQMIHGCNKMANRMRKKYARCFGSDEELMSQLNVIAYESIMSCNCDGFAHRSK